MDRAMDHESILQAMESAIQRGEFAQAAEIGNSITPPLGLPIGELTRSEVLYEGQQGRVQRGSWGKQDVAIKKAKISGSADTERLKAQVRQLLVLGSSPRICPLIAARLLPPEYLLVHPLYRGSLENELQRQRFSWKQIAEFGLQLAEGLAYIHSRGIVHRDVKPGNILIDAAGELHVSDFGISAFAEELDQEMQDRESMVGRHQPSGGFHKRHMVGTLQYLAPEVLVLQPYSYPIDIFAWAVTINELATGVTPYSDCTKDNPAAHTVLNFGYGRQELAAAIVSEGLRPLLRADTPPELASILELGWHLEPSARPSASQLVSQLTQLVGNLPRSFSNLCDSSTVPKTRELEKQRRRMAPQAGHVSVTSHQNQGNGAAQVKKSRKIEKASQNLSQAPGWHASGNSQLPKVAAGVFATAGSRGEDRMEDRHIVASPLQQGNDLAHCFAVFDGHRGSQAAQYACDHMLEHLEDYWAAESAEAALQAAFQSVDEAFQEAEDEQWSGPNAVVGRQRRWPGCTAILALCYRNHLWIANAGDCRAVMCRKGLGVQLNREHSTNDEQERERVQQDGGTFKLIDGCYRLGEAGIQVTRSLGDADLKASGLTACPEVAAFDVTEEDTFLVLGSDGLWDKVSSQDAVDLIHDTVKDPAMCAQRLATEALTRGSGDNITVIVVFLQPVKTLEAIFSAGKHAHRPAKTFYGGRV